MTELAEEHLKKARQALIEARVIAKIGLPETAGCTAYLAAYHAAQAFVVAQTKKTAKTHSGLRSEFDRLAKDDPRIDRAFSAFLVQAYNLKAIADYAVGVCLDHHNPRFGVRGGGLLLGRVAFRVLSRANGN